MFYTGMDNNIAFTSRIRLVSPEEFRNVTGKISNKNFVAYPWTIKESVLAESAFTTDIYDCTVCGITNGQKVLLNHICPTMRENKNFRTIADFIKQKIDLTNENLQGFLLGSKNNSASPDSSLIFENFVRFFKKHSIPFSQFKGGNGTHDVAYSSIKDEWIISDKTANSVSRQSDPFSILKKLFDKTEISELDEVCR